MLSGLAASSTRWLSAIELILPPTVPVGTWLQITPWNILLPCLGALLFAGLLALGLIGMLAWGPWRAAPRGVGFLCIWLSAVIAAYLVAAVWAFGATIANAAPTGLEWAFRSAQPDLLASASFGVVWGWLPALVAVLVAGRRVPDAPGDAQPRRPVRLRWAVILAVALVIGTGAGVVLAQPAAERADRIAAGGTADGLPAVTPSPTPRPAAAPPRVAPNAVSPGANWCPPAQTVLSASGVEGALGHRALTLVLINRSRAACVVDGYPDVAFADADGHAVAIDVGHGSSYTAADPGPTELTVAPGASVEAHLGWAATGARDDTVSSLRAAAYPGGERTPLAIDSDLVAGTSVSVTAWAAPDPLG
jgi:hypothetical protein